MSVLNIPPRRMQRFQALLSVTAVTAALALPAISQTPAPSASPAQGSHSSVHFEGGLLTVNASDASLNSIVREIAQTTGMKISGSVPEDRVFGTYGPEDPQRLLATLLDGTGTNILIVSNQADKPMELVLTRRAGGITPPNPNAADNGSQDEDTDDSVPRRSVPFQPTQGNVTGRRQNSGQAASPSATQQPSEVTQPVVFAPIGTTTAPATGTTTPVNPDDANDPSTDNVKTPQQIFEQLQKLQQANPPTNGTTQQPNR